MRFQKTDDIATVMPTDYDQIAEQYQMAKKSPWRLHIEHFTLFELLGDLVGKSVLDLVR